MRARRLLIVVLSVGLVLGTDRSVLRRTAWGADEKQAEALSRLAVDERVYEGLRAAHYDGADLYNNGNATACYYLFQGALTSVQPLLDHRPELQKAIEKGLAEAKRAASMERRAWLL